MAKITTIISDFSRTLLFHADPDRDGSINARYREVRDTEDFDFFAHFRWNEELFQQYKTLAEQGIKLYVLTTGTVQEDPALSEKMKIFEKVYTEANLGGAEKDDPETYRQILADLQADPDTILFVDDNLGNIEAAKAAGLKVLPYHEGAIINFEL